MNARRGVVAVENALGICCSKAYGLYAVDHAARLALRQRRLDGLEEVFRQAVALVDVRDVGREAVGGVLVG